MEMTWFSMARTPQNFAIIPTRNSQPVESSSFLEKGSKTWISMKGVSPLTGEQRSALITSYVYTGFTMSICSLSRQISTRGATPNTAMIISSLGASVGSNLGLIKVTPTLQLLSHPDIFAIGDILDIPEQKQAGKTGAHAAVVTANISIYLSDPTATKRMKVYSKAPEIIAITNGKVQYFISVCLNPYLISCLRMEEPRI